MVRGRCYWASPPTLFFRRRNTASVEEDAFTDVELKQQRFDDDEDDVPDVVETPALPSVPDVYA